MKITKMKPTFCCRNCIADLESRGEQFAILTNYEDDEEERTVCEWCDEEDDVLKPVLW